MLRTEKADWLTMYEVRQIAGLMDTLANFDCSIIGMGDVPITDTNGEPLGHIEIVQGEVRFVPAGWRSE